MKKKVSKKKISVEHEIQCFSASQTSTLLQNLTQTSVSIIFLNVAFFKQIFRNITKGSHNCKGYFFTNINVCWDYNVV